jgi:hypothetical protein
MIIIFLKIKKIFRKFFETLLLNLKIFFLLTYFLFILENIRFLIGIIVYEKNLSSLQQANKKYIYILYVIEGL